MSRDTSRLVADRTAALEATSDGHQRSVLERIVREAIDEPRVRPNRDLERQGSAVAPGAPFPSGIAEAAAQRPGSPAEAPRASQAERVAALVDTIETFVRGSRDVLELSLKDTQRTSIRIERTAPGEVAVHVRGAASPAELKELRREMLERGLKLSALEVRA